MGPWFICKIWLKIKDMIDEFYLSSASIKLGDLENILYGKTNTSVTLYADIVKKAAITVAEQYSWSTVYQQTRDIYLQQIQRKTV